ncbi:hypothetical protein Btru_031996 [Bulinus truncatus]|nr:hypothetical protein Btru_031996 [Bulinus truncatus]
MCPIFSLCAALKMCKKKRGKKSIKFVQPGTSGKKSNSRDSDQSLISVDSSENEEDLFAASNWKSRVPAKKLSDLRPLSLSADSGMDSIDFCSIQKTELLSNAAAKDKISIKPKARNRQSRKKRDTSSPQTLPSLNEELPTKSLPEDTSSVPSLVSSISTDFVDKLPELNLMTSSTASPKLNKKIDSGDLRLDLAAANTSSHVDKPTLVTPLSAPVVVGTPPVTKVSTPTSPGFKQPTLFKTPEPQTTSLPLSPTSPGVKSSSEINITEKFSGDKLSLSSRGIDKLSVTSANLSQGSSLKEDDKPSMDLKSRLNQFEVKSQAAATTEPALKVSDPDSSITMSPKEDYKLRRQTRSKTLPGTSEEQASPRIQRASSHRIQISASSSPDQPLQLFQPVVLDKSATVTTGSGPQTPPVSTNVKKMENFRHASQDSAPSEPPWKDVIRKKKEDHEEADIGHKNTGSDSIRPALGMSLGRSATLNEKKLESVLVKPKDVTSEKKSESVNSDSQNKTALSKKESLEINVSELSSLKTVKPSQELKNSSVTPADVSSMQSSERSKLLHGSGSMEKDEVPKPSAKELSLLWGSSVRSAQAKSSDVVQGIHNRSGSVKAPASVTSSLGYKMKTTGSQQSVSFSKQSKPDVPFSTKAEQAPVSASLPSNSSVQTAPPSSTSASSTHSVITPAAPTNVKPASNTQSTKVTPSSVHTSKPLSTPSQISSKPALSPMSPTQPAFYGVKPFALGVKPQVSHSSLSMSTPSVSVPAPVSSSPAETSSSSSQPSASNTTFIRSHSAFTPSISSKPQVSTPAPSPTSKLTTQNRPGPHIENKVAAEEKKPEIASSVPAWRANLKSDTTKSDVKIEIIEKTSVSSNSDILRKGSDNTKSSQPPKKNDSLTSGGSNIQLDSSSNRSSKVMDMVKSFQNLKVTS